MVVNVRSTQRRPYPVVFLVDTSGSMADDGKIAVLNEALRGSIELLCSIQDPDLEIWCAVIGFGSHAETIAGWTPVEQLSLPLLSAGGQTAFGDAIERLIMLLDGDGLPGVPHPPALVLASDGQPTDIYDSKLRRLQADERFRLALRLGIRIGADCDVEHLRSFTGTMSAVFTVSEAVTLPDLMVRSARAIQNDITHSSSSRMVLE
jgi:uncharacterized protein YegL